MTGPAVEIGSRAIGEGLPLYVIAEIGINHNGSVEMAKRLIKGAKDSGADSTYPCRIEELNLRMIETIRKCYPEVPVGYSGHETGLAPSVAAVALGASFLERHVTLDRAMWGTDQAASVELVGFERLVRDVRDVQQALGDGIKRVYESELGPRQKLRRIRSAACQ